MEAEYRAILDGRKDQIIRQIRWTKELQKGFVTKGLISRDWMRRIETEANESRAYMVLNQVKLCKDPEAFQVFCELLKETGNSIIAESLLFDKDRVQWGFVKDEKAPNVADFLTIMDEELFIPASNEKDSFRRAAQLNEIRRRLSTCIRHLKNSKKMELDFQRRLIEMHPSEELKKKWEAMQSRDTCMKTFEEMEQEIENRMTLIQLNLSDHVQKLNHQIATLRQEAASMKNGTVDQIPDTVASIPFNHTKNDSKQIEHLKKALAEQDKKLLELEKQSQKWDNKNGESYVIHTSGVNKILEMLQQSLREYNIELSEGSSDVTDVLVKGVQKLVEQLEKMRLRAVQAVNHSSRLEQEKGVSLALLQVRSEGKEDELPEAIKEKMADYEKMKKMDNDKEQEFKRDIRRLSDENEGLREKCKELQEKVNSWLQAEVQAIKKKPTKAVKGNEKQWHY